MGVGLGAWRELGGGVNLDKKQKTLFDPVFLQKNRLEQCISV